MELTKWMTGRTEKGYGKNGLILLDNEGEGNILSLEKSNDGTITFMEECDGCFFVTMSKTDAKQALMEAIAWIDEA